MMKLLALILILTGCQARYTEKPYPKLTQSEKGLYSLWYEGGTTLDLRAGKNGGTFTLGINSESWACVANAKIENSKLTVSNAQAIAPPKGIRLTDPCEDMEGTYTLELGSSLKVCGASCVTYR
jgi:hypothetical protein